MKIGQRVIVRYPDPTIPDKICEIIGGPVIRNGAYVWKVRTIDGDPLENWAPETWMKPLLRAVE